MKLCRNVGRWCYVPEDLNFIEILSISLRLFVFSFSTGNMIAVCLGSGRDSSVGIATRCRLDGPGDRIPVEARFSAPVQTGPGAHPASYTMGAGCFLGVKRSGRVLTTNPHLAPRLKEE